MMVIRSSLTQRWVAPRTNFKPWRALAVAHLRRLFQPQAQTFLRQFVQVVGDHHSPLDFIAFHAKGNPVIWKDHKRMGIHKQLRDIESNLDTPDNIPPPE